VHVGGGGGDDVGDDVGAVGGAVCGAEGAVVGGSARTIEIVATAGVVTRLMLDTVIVTQPAVPSIMYDPPAFSLATSDDSAYLII
jgi:hypothetical protein